MHLAPAPTKAKKKKTAPTAEQMHKPLQEGVPAGRQRWAPLLDLFLPRDAEQSACIPVM